MLKFIKASNTVINAEDIEAVFPSSFTDYNGLSFPRVVVKLNNGNRHNFNHKVDSEVQSMIEDIFGQIMAFNDVV